MQIATFARVLFTAVSRMVRISGSKCDLVKIENLYRNFFTQVPVTGAEQIQDSFVPKQN